VFTRITSPMLTNGGVVELHYHAWAQLGRLNHKRIELL
jgi:hypothetical protein